VLSRVFCTTKLEDSKNDSPRSLESLLYIAFTKKTSLVWLFPMMILHLSLTLLTDDAVEVRYSTGNTSLNDSRIMNISEVNDIVNLMDKYYDRDEHNYLTTGRRLFNWLDGGGTERWLASRISDRMILAVATGERFEHLPWELLADDKGFLIDRGVVPVRWCGNESMLSLESEQVDKNPYDLNLLFMATSPQVRGYSVLRYEQEESRIIQATERAGLQLVVEESGCLTELKSLVRDYGRTHFGVFHLTGHATFRQDTPVFVTETDEGDVYFANASEIVAVFEQLPPVIFLSGCQTGQSAKKGNVFSMSGALVAEGAKAVIGWGKNVLDTEATAAAATLYGELAAGTSFVHAVSATYRMMRQQNCRHWHLLRIFVGDRIPGALVEPKNRRKPQPRMKFAEEEFLDPVTRIVKVASRRTFVGRRRDLQKCLRSLRQDFKRVGVWLHGMGGIGKSSVAARLCDRFPSFERIVIVGRLSESRLESALVKKLRSREDREKLQDHQDSLLFRLRNVLETCDERFLFILDDFEFNLEPIEGRYQLKAKEDRDKIAEVLQDLEEAIIDSGREHRLIVTSRYTVDGLDRRYLVQNLSAMPFIDISKIRSYSGVEKRVSKAKGEELSRLLEWYDLAVKIADGNPKLLKSLDQKLCGVDIDQELLSAELKAIQRKFCSSLQIEHLLSMLSKKTRSSLTRGLVFELPVPRVIFESVCGDGLEQAVALGLLEIFPNGDVRVPRILPLETSVNEAIASQATRELYRVWYQEEIQTKGLCTEEHIREIHRIALLAKDEVIVKDACTLLAFLWNTMGKFQSIIDLCEEALVVVKSQDLRISILNDEAIAYNNMGQPQNAISTYQQIIELSKSTERQVLKEDAVLGNLGYSFLNLGQVTEAIKHLKRALELTQNAENQSLCIHWHNGLGMSYTTIGEFELAVIHYKQVLSLSPEGNNQYKSVLYGNLCDLYGMKGEPAAAFEYAKEAISIQDEIGHMLGKAITLHGMAEVFVDQKRYGNAVDAATEGINIVRDFRIDAPEPMSELHSVIACAYLYQQGTESFNEARLNAESAQKLNSPKNNHYASLLLGIITLLQGNLPKANEFFVTAKSQADSILVLEARHLKALSTRRLALCGLALTETSADNSYQYISDAFETRLQSSALNKQSGAFLRSQELFNRLKTADMKNCLPSTWA
jgi:tetratricopeptide (TPR) repeat protein